MKIELTETLWDLLNPRKSDEFGEQGGTAWMFSDEEYLTIWQSESGKAFSYYNPKLKMPVICNVDKWFKTAGVLTIEDDLIMLEGKDINGQPTQNILYSNKVIELRRVK